MELQQPQSPRTVQVLQESTKSKLDPAYYAIQQSVNNTIEQLRKQRNVENSEALNSALSKHREEILNALSGRIDERCNQFILEMAASKLSIEKLQKDNLELAEKIAQLNSHSSDQGATFLKYFAMASFLALIIGAVASSAKIMALCNHFINQAMQT